MEEMDASTDVPVPIFSGECFQLWSTQMKQYLESQGLLYLIQGYKKPAPVPADEEILELREDLLNDATALMIIRKSLSPIIFTSIHSALTTKDAWNLLQHEFMTPSSSAEQNATKFGKKKKVVVNTEEGCSDVPPSNHEQAERTTINEPPYITMDGRDVETTRSKSDKLCGKRKNVESQEYQVQETLGSTTGNYEVIFSGREELKVGGEGWRQFVADQKLVEGDRLAVKVIKHNHTQREFMVSLPRCTSSPQMQEELNRRGSHQTVTSGMDDDVNSTNVNEVDCNNHVHNVGDDGEDDDDSNGVVENEFQNNVTRYYIIIINKDDIGGGDDMEDEDDTGDGEAKDDTCDVEEEDGKAEADTGDGNAKYDTGDGEAKDDTGDGREEDGKAEADTGDDAKADTGDGEAKADTGNGEVKDDGNNEDDSEDSWEEDGDYVWRRG